MLVATRLDIFVDEVEAARKCGLGRSVQAPEASSGVSPLGFMVKPFILKDTPSDMRFSRAQCPHVLKDGGLPATTTILPVNF